jgi:hypothetical protein
MTTYLPLADADALAAFGRLPDVVRAVLAAHPSAVVAGGYLRSVVSRTPVRDLDIFCPRADVVELVSAQLASALDEPEWALRGVSVTFEHPEYAIQVSALPFDTPETLLRQFDFTVCQAALWMDGRPQTLRSPAFYEDLAGRRLVCASITRAGSSFARALRFLNRGYVADAATWATLVRCLYEDGDNAPTAKNIAIESVIRERLGGVGLY